MPVWKSGGGNAWVSRQASEHVRTTASVSESVVLSELESKWFNECVVSGVQE